MAKNSSFDPATSLPDLTGYIVLITGGHSGLGLATTTALAAKNAKVYIAARSRKKAEEAIKGIKETQRDAKVEVVEMDLADLESVKKGAEEFLRREAKLHILINNAGIMCAPYSETPQGFEIQFATNYLSHFFLTHLLLPTLLSTATTAPPGTVRIINVSSSGHAQLAPKDGIIFDDLNLKDKSTWTRYGHSKLCQVLHAKSVAEKFRSKGLVAVSLHPGTVKTNLAQGPRTSTPLYKLILPLVEWGAPGPEKGCWNTLWCAASPELNVEWNGSYFFPVGKLTRASKWGEDKVMAEKLWRWSEERLSELGFVSLTS